MRQGMDAAGATQKGCGGTLAEGMEQEFMIPAIVRDNHVLAFLTHYSTPKDGSILSRTKILYRRRSKGNY
jgi:hypothetical protein